MAGTASAVLAIGAFFTVDSYRTRTFTNRARAEVREDLRLLAAGASASVVTARLADTEQPGGPGVIVITDGEVATSLEALAEADLPSNIRSMARENPGELVEARTTVDGEPMLVVGAVDDDTRDELFAFYPRKELERSLAELRATLAIGWVAVTALAAIVGTVVARRTLRPVARAAAAARSVAEGLLDTRLPVDGTDEFGEWATSFNEMLTALEEKMEALRASRDRERRFSADIAHELRTPLGTALTAATHLASSAPSMSPSEIDACAQLVVDATRRLDKLTSELLELHRMETDDGAALFEELDVVVVIGELLKAHGWRNVIELRVEGNTELHTDGRRLERIVGNLIANALQHGGPPIVVAVHGDRDALTVDVIDHGLGIANDDVDRIFHRHYKAEAERRSAGSGLGLSIASEAARTLGGSIVVLPTARRGAHFRLLLPRTLPTNLPRVTAMDSAADGRHTS